MKLTDTHSHLYDTAFDADREEALARAAGGGRGAPAAPGHRLRKPRSAVRPLPPPPGAMRPDDGTAPHLGERQPALARGGLALRRTLPHSPARGHRTFLRRGRDRARLLLERRVRRRTGRGFRFAMPPGRTARPSGGDPHPVRHGTTCAGSSGRKRRPRRRPGGGCGACSTPFGGCRHLPELKACGDFAFGIGGVVTFRKSKLADTVREMELDDIVLETDCPYPDTRAPPRRAQRVGLCAVRVRESRGTEGAAPRRSGGRNDGERQTYFRNITP